MNVLRVRFLKLLAGILLCVFSSLIFSPLLSTQVLAQISAQNFKAPFNDYNQVDLSGFWQVMNTAAFNIEAHTAATGIPAGLGVITNPADGKIPYNAAALAKRNQNFANRLTADPLHHCYKPGVPRMTYLPFPLQIIQSENQVTIISEYIHNVRTIALNRQEHLDGVEFWNGDSYGHYEDSSLFVNVGGNIANTWLDEAGNHHSGQLQIEERYTLIGPDHIRYDVTLDDPETYTQPWSMSMVLYRHIEENFRVLEYECHAYAEDDSAAKN